MVEAVEQVNPIALLKEAISDIHKKYPGWEKNNQMIAKYRAGIENGSITIIPNKDCEGGILSIRTIGGKGEPITTNVNIGNMEELAVLMGLENPEKRLRRKKGFNI